MNLPVDDIALFKRVKKDDRVALDTLFTLYYERLCHFAWSFLKVADDSEEAVADIFFILWEKRHTLEIKTDFRAYLYTCVRHKCLSILKKRKANITSIDEELENSLPELNTPERILNFMELKDRIDALVDLLPLRCRQVFILNRYDGLRYKEIAAVMGITEKTVENHLVNALAFLRAHIHGLARPDNILLM
jgi:RNA polymerase sigma-70 factor, ECF subfamily